MQLRHDNALGSVDHEGAVVGHDRNLSEVDLLLLHVADRLRAAAVFPRDQANGHLERGRIGHAALQTFRNVILGLLKRVSNELE